MRTLSYIASLSINCKGLWKGKSGASERRSRTRVKRWGMKTRSVLPHCVPGPARTPSVAGYIQAGAENLVVLYRFKACDGWLEISKVCALTVTDMASVFMFIEMGMNIQEQLIYRAYRSTVWIVSPLLRPSHPRVEELGHRSLNQVQLTAGWPLCRATPSSLSSPHKSASEQVQG